MSQRPKMKSIWEDIFSPGPDSYDSNIKEVLFDSQALDSHLIGNAVFRRLEITLEIFPFDENDVQGQTIHKRITAEGVYIFSLPAREFVVGQMLKNVWVYPDIIRFDIITTGSLLQFECDSYKIEQLPQST